MGLTSLFIKHLPIFLLTFGIRARYFGLVARQEEAERKMIMVKKKQSGTQIFVERFEENKSVTGEILHRQKNENVVKKISRNSSLCLVL